MYCPTRSFKLPIYHQIPDESSDQSDQAHDDARSTAKKRKRVINSLIFINVIEVLVLMAWVAWRISLLLSGDFLLNSCKSGRPLFHTVSNAVTTRINVKD